MITRLVGTLHPENVDNLCYYLVLRFKRLKTNNQLCQPFTQICNTVLDTFLTLLQKGDSSWLLSLFLFCCVKSGFPKGLLTSSMGSSLHTSCSRYTVPGYQGVGRRCAFPNPIISTPGRLHSPVSLVGYNKARRKVGNRRSGPGVTASHDASPHLYT